VSPFNGIVEQSNMTTAESAVAFTLGTTSQALPGDPQALDFPTRFASCAQDPRRH
jgi:hypothetical protein